MPIYAKKIVDVHFAEICRKMRQYAKYVVIVFSHKTVTSRLNDKCVVN